MGVYVALYICFTKKIRLRAFVLRNCRVRCFDASRHGCSITWKRKWGYRSEARFLGTAGADPSRVWVRQRNPVLHRWGTKWLPCVQLFPSLQYLNVGGTYSGLYGGVRRRLTFSGLVWSSWYLTGPHASLPEDHVNTHGVAHISPPFDPDKL